MTRFRSVDAGLPKIYGLPAVWRILPLQLTRNFRYYAINVEIVSNGANR